MELYYFDKKDQLDRAVLAGCSSSSPATPALLLKALLLQCMFIMYASNSHSYTHLIIALGIVRKPVGFITWQYPGIHMTLAGLLAGGMATCGPPSHRPHEPMRHSALRTVLVLKTRSPVIGHTPAFANVPATTACETRFIDISLAWTEPFSHDVIQNNMTR